MGVNYYAITVIGVDITGVESNRKTHVKEKAFNHDYAEDMSFCPKTGKALWKEYDEDIELDELEDGVDNELSVQYATDRVKTFFGLAQTASDDGWVKFDDDISLDEIKNKVKNKLEEYGMWNEKVESSFGIHTILYCSY